MTPAILVADDEPQIRRVLRSTLSSHGYVIIEGQDGRGKRWKPFVRKSPTLLLLDVNMPGIGGESQACREIRQSSDAPIIMLTVRKRGAGTKCSHSMREADDYVVKPFGIEELLARIRAALRRYAPGDTLASFCFEGPHVRFRKPAIDGGAVRKCI